MHENFLKHFPTTSKKKLHPRKTFSKSIYLYLISIMAKQKIVIRVVSMKCQKSRSKAMKIAVGVPGVESAAIHGDSKDEIEVTGENVDSVKLTSLLRKKFCHAVLVSVGEVKKKEEKKEEAIVPWTCVPSNSIPHCYPVYEIRNPCQSEDPSCSIM